MPGVLVIVLAAAGLGAAVGLVLVDNGAAAAHLPAAQLQSPTAMSTGAGGSATADAPADRSAHDVLDDGAEPGDGARAGSAVGDRPTRPSPGPSAEPSGDRSDGTDGQRGGPPDWAVVLGHLDALRSQAFATGDAGLLADVYGRASPLLATERETLAALAATGLRPVGLSTRVDAVSVARDGSDEVVLQVVDHMPAYVLVGADGAVVERRTGRGAATWLITLHRELDSWRIETITRKLGG